jgi:tetratricopeptide repeat protein 8
MAAAAQLDPLFAAQAKYRRRDMDGCIEACTALLVANPYDQAAWLLKCRALAARNYVDDVEWDDEGIAEVLLDDNAVAQAPRPGTSLKRPGTSARPGAGLDSAVRPMTASGRPLTGFARPGTSMRAGGGMSSVDAAFRGSRPGTSRVMTAMGRVVRLGTASLASAPGGPFIQADRLDMRKYAGRPALGKALCDYLLYVDHNPKKALELCAAATVASGYNDWWWKERLGKCYHQLGLFRDAEAQFRSSIRQMDMVATYLQLANVYARLDQPAAAQEVYRKGIDAFPGDVSLLLASARVHDTMGDSEAAANLYRRALATDASNVEAIACLASQAFYADQPEVALKYYRRLLQMGAAGVELWTNLALATFYASQYDLSLSCFERAIAAAEDDTALGDVWYNVAAVAVGLGDVTMAYQALKVALALDPSHAEAHVNLGVLEVRKGNHAAGAAHFSTAQRLADWLYESWYNGALAAMRAGDLQSAFKQCQKALEAFPEHADSQELMQSLKEQFMQAR